MKVALYLNYFLLTGAGIFCILALYTSKLEDIAACFVFALALYQLLAGGLIALIRLFSQSPMQRFDQRNVLIWFYWLGVVLFFFALLPNSSGFPWYGPTFLAIFFSYILHIEINPDENK